MKYDTNMLVKLLAPNLLIIARFCWLTENAKYNDGLLEPFFLP